MLDHYDRLESRTHAARENVLFRDLRHVLGLSKTRIPSLRAQLKGVDIAALMTRADLAQIPLMRRADVLTRQAEFPPFGGMNTMRVGALKQAFLGTDHLVSLEGHARDWWGMGRALFAAGLRKGTMVLNCFPYDLAPEGHMVASGAAALNCPVIPAGAADIDRKLDLIVRLKPGFFCGRSEEFKRLLDTATDRDLDTGCIKAALVTGPTSAGRRGEYEMRGFGVRHVFMLPELGVVAYETDKADHLTIGESYIAEIIDPVSGSPAEQGRIGELVVTRISNECPILRYATGFHASVSTRNPHCGRTNTRITTPVLRPDTINFGGRSIHISHIREIAKHHPTVGRISLVMRRCSDDDVIHLRVEHSGQETALIEGLRETLHLVTRLRGTVEIVAPGTLSEDEPMIVDERHLN